MKFLKKAIIIVIAFAIAYGGVMLVAYNYLYEYPIGFLDTFERADGARFYRVVKQAKLDKSTLLYFARSNNGVGTAAHVGTLQSKVPNFIANFFCESTSSYYLPVNTISYGITNDTNKTVYLFGSTTDQNTVKVIITFTKSETEKQEYEMVYDKQCFYYIGFDASWADYPCHVVGYNTNNGITFQYNGDPILLGQYTPAS